MSTRPAPLSSPLRREIRGVVGLAAPVVFVHLGMMLMGTVDVMMLGRLDATSLAAGALGNSVGIGILMFPLGVLMALDPMVAQSYGAGEHERVARHLQRGIVLAVVMSLLAAALMWNTEGALRFVGQQEPMRGLAAQYIRALIPGAPAFLLYASLRLALQAMSIVRPAVIVILIANVVNVVANYGLIFGRLGLPELGVVGSALATSTSRWFMAIGLVVVAWRQLERYLRPVGRRWLAPRRFRDFVRVGGPVGLQVSLEVWVFSTVAVIMGSLGALELAGHQIAISLASLTFMIPLGIAGAAATRVGNAIGRDDQAAARRSAVVCLWSGGAVMVLFAVVLVSAPRLLARLFTPDLEVVAMAAVLLPIAGVFQVADGVQVVGAGILRGTADTRGPALIAFVGYWVLGLPTGLWLAYRVGFGSSGLWWGMTVGLSVVALLFLVRIRRRFRGRIERLVTE